MINRFKSLLNEFVGKGEQQRFLYVSIIIRFIPLLTLPVISRLYSPADFGVYAVYYGIVAICGPLFALQTHQRVCIEKGARLPSLIMSGHLISFILFLICAFVFSFFASNLDDYLPYYLAIITSFFSASYFITYNLMLRRNKFSMISLRNAFVAIGVPVIQIVFSNVWDNYMGLIYANTLCFFMLALHGIYYAYKELWWKFRRVFKLGYIVVAFRRNLGFSVSVTFSGFLNTVALHLPIFVVERMLGSHQAGLLSMTMRIGQFPFDAIGNYVQDVFKSKVSGRDSSMFGMFKRMSFMTLIVYLSMVVAGLLVLPWILPFLLGKEWAEVSDIVPIVLFVLLVRYTVSPYSYILLVANRLRYNFYWQIFNLMLIAMAFTSSLYISELFTLLGVYLVAVSISYMILYIKCYREAKYYSNQI